MEKMVCERIFEKKRPDSFFTGLVTERKIPQPFSLLSFCWVSVEYFCFRQMGTNFYWIDDEAKDEESKEIYVYDPKIHIGKRCAAGPYCEDCGVTLHTMGTQYVHSEKGSWHENCPSCAKKVPTSTCSFTWSKMGHLRRIVSICCSGSLLVCIRDENGVKYTAKEFLSMLKDCPIYFQSCCEFAWRYALPYSMRKKMKPSLFFFLQKKKNGLGKKKALLVICFLLLSLQRCWKHKQSFKLGTKSWTKSVIKPEFK